MMAELLLLKVLQLESEVLLVCIAEERHEFDRKSFFLPLLQEHERALYCLSLSSWVLRESKVFTVRV